MDIVLRNIMEDIVMKRIDDILPTLNCCQCKACKLDIASYALNRLPAKYVVTTQGELLSRIDSLDLQFETSITARITEASMVVAKQPRHE